MAFVLSIWPFLGVNPVNIHSDTLPRTVFCTSTSLYECLHMPQGTAGASAWFLLVMRLVTTCLDDNRRYLDDAIGSDDFSLTHVATLSTIFARLRLYKLNHSPDISGLEASRVNFFGHLVSGNGVHLYDDRVAPLSWMPIPSDIEQ